MARALADRRSDCVVAPALTISASGEHQGFSGTLSIGNAAMANVVIEHLPWQECVRRYDRAGTLFYLDPPYWQTEGYGVDFGMEQYEEMAGLMRAMKGRAVLSINDHPQIRQAFEGLPLLPLQLEYSMARQATGKKSGELIIKSWEDDQLPMWG